MLKKLAILASALLLSFPAFAQNVQYITPVTRNHIPVWNTNGVIADGGSSADSPISSIGVTNEGGAGFCVSSGRQTAAGRNQLCFGASTAGPATISLQNFGTATAQNLQFIINGTVVTVPTGGTNFLQLSGVATNGHVPCFSGTIGLVVDCGTSIGAGTQFGLPYYSTTSSLASTGAGSNGQVLIGQTGAAPLWQTLSGDVASVSPGGALTLGNVNGIPFLTTYGANGVLIGEGTNAFHSVSTLNVGQCLLSQGASDPIWSSCASGSGSAGGSNTQVQFNNATALGGSPNLTWVSPTLTIGVAGTATGQLQLAPAGSGTGTVTIQNPSTTSAYNFNLPTTAGSLGQPMLSGGGGSTAMSFGTLGISGGGTNCTAASGTCLDNITGFASTGFVQRTGAGSYTFSLTVPVSGGGTGLANGTSGGILGFTGTTTIASSALLAQNGFVIGGGAGATPTSITACTNGQMPVGSTGSAPTCQTLSGDITTVTSGGLVTIANSAITVAKQANAAAWTLEGNFTGSSAAPQFSAISSLTVKASPAAGDLVIIQDQSAAGALKQATVSSISSAGSVSSIDTKTGSFTTGNGLDSTAGNIIEMTAARRTLPTTTTLNSGSSSTYTTPANALWIEVYQCGGGGGGSGSTSGSLVSGSDGTKTTFNSIDAAPGKGAISNTGGVGGSGGAGAATRRARGGSGISGVRTTGTTTIAGGGQGGATYCGAGPSTNSNGVTSAGTNADANSGAGGSGAQNYVSSFVEGGGGGAGELVYQLIDSPSATYIYTIGGGGNGGSSTQNGGNGGTGKIFIIEHYGS
jgi:hypothetical protein